MRQRPNVPWLDAFLVLAGAPSLVFGIMGGSEELSYALDGVRTKAEWVHSETKVNHQDYGYGKWRTVYARTSIYRYLDERGHAHEGMVPEEKLKGTISEIEYLANSPGHSRLVPESVAFNQTASGAMIAMGLVSVGWLIIRWRKRRLQEAR